MKQPLLHETDSSADSHPTPGPRPPRHIWTGTEADAQGKEVSTVYAHAGEGAGESASAPAADSVPAKDSAPSQGKKRVIGIDAARGFAVVGMICVHTMPEWYDDGEATWAWMLFSGKSAPLFAMLAGVSLAFMTGGRRPRTGVQGNRSRVAIAVRALVLFFLGACLNAVNAQTPENILPYYGVLFLLSIPFTTLRIRHLLFSAAFFATAGPALMFWAFKYMNAGFLFNPSLKDMVNNPGLTFLTLTLTGTYPAFVWMTYICIGMAVGRMKLGKRAVQWGILGAGAVTVVVTAVLSDLLVWWLPTHQILVGAMDSEDPYETLLNYSVYGGAIGTLPTDHPLWLAVIGPHLNTPLSETNSAGFALVAIGVLALLASKLPLFFRPLATMGTMTLTLYVAHCAALEPLQSQDIVDASFAQILLFQLIVAAVFANTWKHFFAQGPLERPVSSISKWLARYCVPGKEDGTDQRKDHRPPRFDPEADQV